MRAWEGTLWRVRAGHRRAHSSGQRNRRSDLLRSAWQAVEPLEGRMLLACAPVGPMFLVNTTTAGDQKDAAVAMAPGGDFIVAWAGQETSGTSNDVFAQRYSASGSRIGGEFRVNTTLPGLQHSPAIAIDQQGDFVIAWIGQDPTTSQSSVYAQRYNAAGARQGGEIVVGINALGYLSPSIAIDADGDFALAWKENISRLVYTRAYDAAGNPKNSANSLAISRYGWHRSPSIAMDPDGDYAVAWEDRGIFLQRFNSSGTAIGATITVNSSTLGSHWAPTVAMDGDGDMIVTWEWYRGDGSSTKIYVRRYDSAGTSQGDEFRVTTATGTTESSPTVLCRSNGDFLVNWTSWTGQGNQILTQRYKADGTPIDQAVAVNRQPPREQIYPAVAMDTDGDFVVAWEIAQQDSSGYGIYAQRFGVSTHGATLGNRVWVDTDKDGLQDSSEKGLDDVTVNLFNDAGVLISGTTTTDGGKYQFDGILPNQPVSIQFILPAGYVFTNRDVGSNNSIDSDVDPATGSTHLYTLAPDQVKTNVDCGLLTEATIAGTIYLDDNANAKRDGGESGLSGAVVFLDTDRDHKWDVGEPRQHTRANGTYRFYSLRPGSYHVVLQSRRHALHTNPDDGCTTVSLAVGQLRDTIDFGVKLTPPSHSPLGRESRINNTTHLDQQNASIAFSPRGDYVVVWQDPTAGASGIGAIYARRYSALGTPLGREFRVNTLNAGNPSNPDIAIDDKGNFTIVWDSFGEGNGPEYGIFARRYDSKGRARGNQFIVSDHAYSRPAQPKIAMDNDGDFVVSWQSWYVDCTCGPGVFARRYDNKGQPREEDAVQVNTYTSGWQWQPDVAMDAFGNYVVVWRDENVGNSSHPAGMYFRRYTADGQPRSDETLAPDGGGAPAIAMDDSGNFTIAWSSAHQPNLYNWDTEDDEFVPGDIYALRFKADGEVLGDSILISTLPNTATGDPAIAMDDDGDFIVAWTGTGQDPTDDEIFARRLDSAGRALGEVFRLNTHTPGHQRRPAIAMNPRGDFIAAWQSQSQDGSGYGIYARRYRATTTHWPFSARATRDPMEI